ncbi:uncharacterized protein LOC102801845 [Saccoglossus kowalevskii]|uniref:Uncharacterized protein LOC102801845 isoform X1 n=1 Tax=Saccoglossus kowalevskii TaxID=10224 RepID=A0ABM0LXD5_SACKO|nr:PREDICTED: uncharacterized protein LOC102801845 isoform X1 [Saccoglossus kowalevskii]XP_006812426.1 PREDICTED: uncharacterized protein LOC102801845 isoform X2 [Saccoglossus kowalevskii]
MARGLCFRFICSRFRSRKIIYFISVIIATIYMISDLSYIHQNVETISLSQPNEGSVLHKTSRENFTTKELRYPHVTNKSTTVTEGIHVDWRIGVEKKFPWVIRQKYLVNYYIYIARTLNAEHERYKSASLVFLHHNKAAGTTVKTCLSVLASAETLRVGPVMASQTRVSFHTSEVRRNRYANSRIFMGGYSFGVCDELNLTDRSCSYFTFLRDPYERIISSYEYCKRARSDQLCSALNANEVTLKQWAKHQGNFFFRQLLFEPGFCQRHYDSFIDIDSELHDDKWSSRNKGSLSCWFREKLILQNLTTITDRKLLLWYALDKLTSWFAVIGLAEEYELSMQLLEGAYGLPFNKMCGRMKRNYNLYQQSNETDSTKTQTVMEMKNELMADNDVKETLYYDLQIYEKAKDIFRQQKESYFELHGEHNRQ